MTIEMDDIKLEYVTIAEARKMSGLRIVLPAFALPGPWREACKGVYYVKGLEYTPVRTANEGAPEFALGMEGTQSELIEWTGQASAPVVAWNDERPRSSWIDQLVLAERLAPEPALIPADTEDRIRMFGLANELLGEYGILWQKRFIMVHDALAALPEDDPQRPLWVWFGDKYGYTPERAQVATEHVKAAVETMAAQMQAQHARGSRYLIGTHLTALDIYWGACCAALDPMPAERCPMADAFRGLYGNTDEGIARALIPALLEHRDFIYDEHLELPIVF